MKKRYVDGYVLTIKKKDLKKYKKLAVRAGKIWMKCGALHYVESVGEELKSAAKMGCLPFPKMAQTKPGETVIFAYVVYRSRAHRDKVNKKVYEEWVKQGLDHDKDMPFDTKRMAFGGFETIVNLRRGK